LLFTLFFSLQNEVTFKMRITDEQKVMDGHIRELQLFTCSYGKLGKQYANRQTVLVPCEVSLAASAAANSGWHVEILLTDIRINVSPGDD